MNTSLVHNMQTTNPKFKHSISVHVQVCHFYAYFHVQPYACNFQYPDENLPFLKKPLNLFLILTSYIKHINWVNVTRINSSLLWNLDCCICSTSSFPWIFSHYCSACLNPTAWIRPSHNLPAKTNLLLFSFQIIFKP